MEELTVLQQSKIAQTQQVLMLLFYEPKLKITDACERIGIEPHVYRYWLSHGGDSINVVRSFIDQQQRELVSEIAIAKGRSIRMMIDEATNVLTKPLERKALFESLSQELDELQTVYNVRPGIEEEAQAFLKKGPTIEKKRSRFASIDIEETDSGFRIGLNEDKDIVDGEIIEG